MLSNSTIRLTSLLLVFGMSSVFAHAIKLKLDCQILGTRDNGKNISETIQHSEVFEVIQHDEMLNILSTSNKFASVSTFAVKLGFSVKNFTDENKWDLRIEKPNNQIQITIDRNTGKIYLSQYVAFPDGGEIRFKGDGTCRKVDTDKKLF